MINSSSMASLLVKYLEEDKSIFLSNLHNSIENHVSKKKANECLELVTTRNGKSVKWYISDGVPYIKRLISYLRKTSYKEDGRVYEVDSALTSDILDIVSIKMTNAIEKHQDLITDIAMAEILLNDITQKQLINALLGGKSAKILSAKGKSIIATALLHGIQQKLSHIGTNVATDLCDKITHVLAVVSKTTIVTTVAGVTTKAIASTGGKVILTKLSLAISKSLTPIIGKLLAMPAIKIALKKIVVAAVIGSVAKVIAAKIGMSIGAAIWVVLIPLIAAFLIKDIIDLPKKLGVALADAVTSDLSTNYKKTMTEIVNGLLSSLISGQIINEIGKNLGDDPDVAKELNNLISVVAEGAVSY